MILKCNRDIATIKPIYLISTIPPYNFETKSLQNCKFHKFACFLNICLLIVLYIMILIGIIVYFYSTIVITLLIVDFGVITTQTFAIIYITSLPLLKRQQIEIFFKIMDGIDKKLKVLEIKEGKGSHKFYGEIILEHIFFTVILVYDYKLYELSCRHGLLSIFRKPFILFNYGIRIAITKFHISYTNAFRMLEQYINKCF